MDRNVVIYGRYEKRPDGDEHWTFAGPGQTGQARTPREAVVRLNELGYEVVAVTETGAPGDSLAWSNMYIFGKVIE